MKAMVRLPTALFSTFDLDRALFTRPGYDPELGLCRRTSRIGFPTRKGLAAGSDACRLWFGFMVRRRREVFQPRTVWTFIPIPRWILAEAAALARKEDAQ